MSSLLPWFRRTGLVLGLLLAGVAVPAAAQADPALDLVRTVVAECAAGPRSGTTSSTTSSTSAHKPRTARPGPRRIPARVARRAGLPQLRLTAEQRGSGRVNLIDLSDSPAAASSPPAVERKGPWTVRHAGPDREPR